MKEMRIYFYASLPKEGQPPFGGGEVGNLRTLKMLRNAGYEVICIRHRRSDARWGIIRTLMSHPFRLLGGWGETFFKLLFAPRNSLVHLSGFAGKTILNEYVLMHIMRGLGFKVIYEIRGGGIVGFWDNGSPAYRKMFSYLVNNACSIFSQGKENFPLLQTISKTPIYHYPNCVEKGFAPDGYTNKPKEKLNLLFYGRLEDDKHVDIVVEAASIVQKTFQNVFLRIVGNGNMDYVKRINDLMSSRLVRGTYIYETGKKHDELKNLLRSAHFYIFPSTQPREGQSNSVTECMSYGVIPIASPQGFNRSTIGDDSLIVENLEPEQYAKKIIDILKSGKTEEISRQMYNRYIENYTEEVVTKRTLGNYSSIMDIVMKG